jgi:hypothetical protein
MNATRGDEIAASVGAHRDLGPGYEDALAEGLVERIGAEVDRRVDQRLAQQSQPQKPASRPESLVAVHAPGRVGFWAVVLGLGSMGMGLGVTAVVVHGPSGQAWLAALIWIAIAVINISYARRR